MIRPGQLNKRIEFQVEDVQDTSIGFESKTWVTYKMAWAKKERPGVGPGYQDNYVMPGVDALFTIRHDPSVDGNYDLRIVHGDRTYRIELIDETVDGEELIVHANDFGK